MKSLKTLFLGSTVAAGVLLSTQAFADSTYTVQSGDTLSSISTKYFGNNDSVAKIAKDNKIDNVHMIHVGQTLTIKTDGQAEEKTAVPAVQQQTEAAPVQQEVQPVKNESTSNSSGQSSSAKEFIAQKESGGDYNASNGHHVGRYQLDPSYLNGDYSPANQERVADQYVNERYGSWENAQSFWMNNGWY
ncbi:aggregation-promoting factor [Vagococcus vulneris]|uniref:Peptidase M23 n=1 Tax=Vagococcus vulneris TaxID=1977869 RepID=A0A429ZUG4_9ENTE|nr:LysM peptidoglycan-binding domain-containing protein [Vagococcus vulneris]RST97318.1 peptidase M23 [Vagococcus vulneris]